MWHCDTILRSTKRGKVIRSVHERYLRQDIQCCIENCELCQEEAPEVDELELPDDEPEAELATNINRLYDNTLSANPVTNKYYIPTVDALAAQMDVFQHADCPLLSNFIILETVWQAIRAKDLSAYNRLQTLFKSDRRFVVLANEHFQETYYQRLPDQSLDERASHSISQAAIWYKKHIEALNKTIQIVLLTNTPSETKIYQQLVQDAEIQPQKIHVESIQTFVEKASNDYPKLTDLLAHGNEEETKGTGGSSNAVYRRHLPVSELLVGIQSKRFFQGTIRVNRSHWSECHVLINGQDDNGEKARISALIQGATNINRSIDGDVVAIELLPKSEWRTSAKTFSMNKDEELEDDEKEKVPEGETPHTDLKMETPTLSTSEVDLSHSKIQPCGRVVGVITRNWRQYCGSLQLDDRMARSDTSIFIPVDQKIPRIRIKTRQREQLLDKRIVVVIDSWPEDSRMPLGHYVRTVGLIGDKATETKVLLHEHDIPVAEFSEKVLACLPPSDWQITPENSQGRTDLRHLPVMSIDPPGCKDIDDALHVRELENGNLEVGVHIADVTHFVAPGSALDMEAADRGTSTYLVERRLDMLPGLLTTELCSLTANTDHFAFSVIWEMTKPNPGGTNNAEIVNVSFCKSIIHSVAALSYGEAQTLLDSPDGKDKKNVQSWSVHQLHAIATQLRRRRIDAGALTLASPEVRFVLDTETQNPLDVQMYALKDTNALVEEFMLLANITVAKKILRHFPTFSMLRRHPAPSKRQFDPLVEAAATLGVEIKVDTSRQLADSLDAARRYQQNAKKKKLANASGQKAGQDEDTLFNKMLRILATRCMMPAAYFCSGEFSPNEYHHYGLAAPIYTHFTSPIRRYADVVVHRLLAAAIGVAPLPAHLENKALLNDVAQNLNRRHLAAQMAGRASVALHTLIYFREHPCQTEAIVTRLRSNGIGVMLPRFGVEGMIFLCLAGQEDSVLYDEKEHTIALAASPDEKLRFLDRIQVRVFVELSVGNRHELKIQVVEPAAFDIAGKLKQAKEAEAEAKKSKSSKNKRKSQS